MTAKKKDKLLGYHFLQEDKRLRWGTKEAVKVGRIYKVDGPLSLCEHGLHASVKAIDALHYAPGPIVCRVELSGEIIRGTDKACATRRKVLAMADATKTLHLFACWCAKRALKSAKVEDERSWNGINVKLKWLKGQASDSELDAARDAARDADRDAARDAARAAAWAAARDAAWAAARAAARDAAWAAARAAARDAAWAAAWDAAWAAQNKHLEAMFKKLLVDKTSKK